MLNLIRIFTIILLVFPTYTYAVPKSVEIYIKKPELVGSGRLKFWMWDVYDAYLYGPKGEYNPSKPFALSIRYLMSFSSKSLTDRTIKEIRGQGYNNKKMLNLWKQKLTWDQPVAKPVEEEWIMIVNSLEEATETAQKRYIDIKNQRLDICR